MLNKAFKSLYPYFSFCQAFRPRGAGRRHMLVCAWRVLTGEGLRRFKCHVKAFLIPVNGLYMVPERALQEISKALWRPSKGFQKALKRKTLKKPPQCLWKTFNMLSKGLLKAFKRLQTKCIGLWKVS